MSMSKQDYELIAWTLGDAVAKTATKFLPKIAIEHQLKGQRSMVGHIASALKSANDRFDSDIFYDAVIKRSLTVADPARIEMVKKLWNIVDEPEPPTALAVQAKAWAEDAGEVTYDTPSGNPEEGSIGHSPGCTCDSCLGLF